MQISADLEQLNQPERKIILLTACRASLQSSFIAKGQTVWLGTYRSCRLVGHAL